MVRCSGKGIMMKKDLHLGRRLSVRFRKRGRVRRGRGLPGAGQDGRASDAYRPFDV